MTLYKTGLNVGTRKEMWCINNLLQSNKLSKNFAPGNEGSLRFNQGLAEAAGTLKFD